MEWIVSFLSTQAQSQFERNIESGFQMTVLAITIVANGAIGIPANFLQLAMEKSRVQDAISFGFDSHL